MEDNKDQIQGQEGCEVNQDRLVENLISRLEDKGYLVAPKDKLPPLKEGERWVEVESFPLEDRLVEKLIVRMKELIDKLIERMKEERFIRDEELINDLKTPLDIEELRQELAEVNEEESLPEGKCGDILVEIDGKWRWVTPLRYNDLKTPNVCIGGPNVSVSPFIKEPLPQFIKDMYKLPFDLDTFKTPSCKAEVPREEMEEFNKSDLQLLREFFAREWKAAKELWKAWRSK
jgi:hypothetical protein